MFNNGSLVGFALSVAPAALSASGDEAAGVAPPTSPVGGAGAGDWAFGTSPPVRRCLSAEASATTFAGSPEGNGSSAFFAPVGVSTPWAKRTLGRGVPGGVSRRGRPGTGAGGENGLSCEAGAAGPASLWG